MNIAILQKKETISMSYLRRALEKRGHNIYSLHSLYLEPNNLDEAQIPDDLDLLYYWNGAGTVGRVCLCDYLHNKGVKVVNRGIFTEPLFVNKIYQLYKIGLNDILAPKTVTQTYASYEEIINKIGSPFILKSAVGACGEKVYLIKNEDEYEDARLMLKGQELLYQEFIPKGSLFI
jgi:glutathione synthase/RimK-type ligase-like ATP-grasp enzyme